MFQKYPDKIHLMFKFQCCEQESVKFVKYMKLTARSQTNILTEIRCFTYWTANEKVIKSNQKQ